MIEWNGIYEPDGHMVPPRPVDDRPIIPRDVSAAIMASSVNTTLLYEAMKKYPLSHSHRQPWYRRWWWRVNAYLPRVSVHIGPRPGCYCDD